MGPLEGGVVPDAPARRNNLPFIPKQLEKQKNKMESAHLHLIT